MVTAPSSPIVASAVKSPSLASGQAPRLVSVDVLRGIVMGSARIKRDIPMLARLYLQGRFNLDDLVSRRINISEINEAYADLNGRVARSVITSF